ncbi:S26 family signal peptidase [Salinilacihabitans rarus]|uniref:S26 family signal peptidase n=1 Tax=Salinilacihabitans rarus TaxID=2961596 RepID=UPI0020C832DB|nr:S26 family signal peptidase [Salinilacihabitans rarus]
MSGHDADGPSDSDDRTDRRTGDAESTDEPGESRSADARSNGGLDRGDSRPKPAPSASARDDPVSIEEDGYVRWFLRTDDGTVVAIRDVLSSVAIVAIIGLVLFGVSGIWPPLVAVESGSMEPHMSRGDLIFVVDEGRFVGDGAVDGTGIVTLEDAEDDGYDKFDEPGDVIIFVPNGNEAETPVIHRAHFWVEEGDNWVDGKAEPAFVNGASCDDVLACPAPHDGFVTKGDANPGYDQYAGGGGAQTTVVKPEWVTGKAMFRIPWLGHIRLTFEDAVNRLELTTGTAGSPLEEPATLEVGLVGAASAVALIGGRRPGHR